MSKLFKNKYRINSCRLPQWNYSKYGYYFITICTKNKINYFGQIKNGQMVLSSMGKIIYNEWYKTEKIRPQVILDEFVVMPNHIHGILIINDVKIDYGNMDVETHCNDAKIDYGNMDVETHCNNTKIDYGNMDVETHCNASLLRNGNTPGQYKNKFGPQRNNIPSIIRGFKSICTKKINVQYGYNYFAWQSRYYDVIIHNEKMLFNVRNYIKNNPKKWWHDRNNLQK